MCENRTGGRPSTETRNCYLYLPSLLFSLSLSVFPSLPTVFGDVPGINYRFASHIHVSILVYMPSYAMLCRAMLYCTVLCVVSGCSRPNGSFFFIEMSWSKLDGRSSCGKMGRQKHPKQRNGKIVTLPRHATPTAAARSLSPL